ncbi:hypothetical protein TIFTF001_019214 [Ficus carica]|uniref:DUF761 domain-containing protein n=1 Tax=Ficus carica TaxID=3494 RepID=A0AA88AB85_FICCA|nr:hypothetical protein TIFTF001_019214 [Ficus carica]
MKKNTDNDGKGGGGQFFREKRSSNAEEKKKETTSNTSKLETKPSMDINESAEAFIKNFRQQLLIQRLDSIENYQQMLARGL